MCPIVGSVLLIALLSSSQAFAQACDEQWSAELIEAEGTVEVRRRGEPDWSPARRGDEFCVGDSIRVQAYSRAAISVPGETDFRLDQNTIITFTPPQDQKRSWLNVLRGALQIISRDRTAVQVLTPFANAGIEGTEFLVVVTDEETSITVFEGTVAVSNAAGEVAASSGQRVSARSGQLPVVQAVVRPRDAVQWTLYYSPVLDRPLPEADESASPQSRNDPSFYVGRAARRLEVGRADEARQDISEALSLDPGNVEALSLESMLAVTQNDKDEALRLANLAVARGPPSATALIALSYAQQAFFDVSGALASLQEAVRQEPQNALAWARLSEMWLAVGDLDQALRAAQEAVSLDPNVARTQTVLGFAYLTRAEIEQATKAFQQAIALDQSAPLPYLGLGLAMIRDGELVAGRREIETAVILDPGNALIRSYMGKAYYEERRNELARSQLEIAKELDPLDPTAWFYDAIREQTVNQPGEALQDIQKSIELNDNRAVYRSRLLLDEDLAARSASLGRIYRDLGFEQLALLQGWASVAADPSDFSGHRLLADVYAQLPRHQIARVNELFRSQLLQPINVTPILPQLAEANLFILDSAGPADLGFNEFNSLFESNGLRVQGSGVLGANATRGDDIVLSGIRDRFSYSLGQFHFETDGFRENNDIEQDVANAFFQFAVSPKTSLQAELRSTDTEKGDLRLLFDPTNYSPNRRQKEKVNSVRIGARHSFNSRSDNLLASLIYQDASLSVNQAPIFGADTDYDSYSLDVQYLHQRENWHLIAGINYIDLDRSDLVTQTLSLPFPPFSIESTLATSDAIGIGSAYVYTTLSGIGRAQFTLGASFDSVDSTEQHDNSLNPKFGIIWPVSPRTTLRAAAFRTVQPPFISRQNIQPRLEPTQVAGFNQFYFGTSGEEVRHYGIAVDHEFSPRLYVGLQAHRRDIDFPFFDFTAAPPARITIPIERDFTRAYVNYLATDRLAVGAELQFENRDNHDVFIGEGFGRLQTKRVPLRATYHHPNGFGGALAATYVDQEGDFENLSMPPPFPVVTETFWVLDASISYRFPRRRGVIELLANNLLDEQFRFQDSDPENPQIQPERVVFLKFTLAY